MLAASMTFPDCEMRPSGDYGLLSCFFPDRHREAEDSAVGVIRLCPQPPAVGIDDRAANRQPQAQAAALCRVERVEDSLGKGLRQSRPRIAYRYEHAVRSGLVRADQQLARFFISL